MDTSVFGPGVLLATSTKADGNMHFSYGEREAVVHNREAFLLRQGLTLGSCVVMQVEHGETITVVDSAHKNTEVFAEALITQEKSLALLLPTADCLPISLYDPKKKVVALAHLGWRPTSHRLVEKVIERLVNEFGSRPQNLLVHVGPSIHKESYVFKELEQKKLPLWAPYLHELQNGETQVDVVGYNVEQMLGKGVQEENITVEPIDTATTLEYFSHYRSVRTNEPEGRFATVLMMRSQAS